MNDRKPIAINAAQGRRIANAVRAVENDYAPDQRRSRVNTFNPGIMRAKCTTAIPAGTWAAPSSSGEVQIYHFNAETNDWEASEDPVPCFNAFDSGDDVAVDATCLVAWISGQTWLVNADCGDA